MSAYNAIEEKNHRKRQIEQVNAKLAKRNFCTMSENEK